MLLPADILAVSPSCRDGVDGETEALHRILGCEVIQEVGILLRLPQVVMCTAQNVFQRFFYRKSLVRFDAFNVAMGCFFLACKIEEKAKRIRETVFAFQYVLRRRKPQFKKFELGDATYSAWKAEVVRMERHILKELGFSFYVIDHAHKFLLFYVKLLDGDQPLAQKAWSYLNDSMRLDLCLRYKSEVIACAAVFLAARNLQKKLPTEGDATWWQVFQVHKPDLDAVVHAILSLYARDKIVWLEPLTKGPRITDDKDDDVVATAAETTR